VRRLVLTASLLAAVLVATAARGQEAQPRADGYEFGKPRLLTQQLLWGLAHGVELLATTCRGADEGAAAIARAYDEWLVRNRQRIDAAARELSRHYFGQDTAPAEALAAALHLKPALDLPPDELAPTCASFVEAVAASRYDLDLFYELRRDAARIERAEAVRTRVTACLKNAAAEPAARLEASFSAWAKANELLESVSRSRLLAHKGDNADDRQWRHDAGGGAIPPAIACEELAGALSEPGHALANAFEEDR
jgi:hypothetical protein